MAPSVSNAAGERNTPPPSYPRAVPEPEPTPPPISNVDADDSPVLTSDDILYAALEAQAAGLSVIPIVGKGSKASRIKWSTNQRIAATADQIRKWHQYEPLTGIGIVGGVGGIVHIDFDHKDAFSAFVSYGEAVGLGALITRVRDGYCDRTPHGYRLTYRTAAPFGCEQLAFTADGQSVLVETKGVGGYAICAPALPSVHASGHAYIRVSGNFDQIVTISAEEQDDLLSLARVLNQAPVKPTPEPTSTGNTDGGVLPGDEFAEQTEWSEILEPHDWTVAFEKNDITYWTRPGKDGGVSASSGHGDSDLLYVFSTNCAPLPAARTSSKFHVHALLNFDGDHKKAAAALRAEGFGSNSTVDKDALLEEMNQKHGVVVRGGRTEVVSVKHDPSLRRNVIEFSSFADIRNRYSNVHVPTKKVDDAGNVKLGTSTLGTYWLNWPKRRSYDGVGFAPEEQLPGNYFNLWQGFAVAPRQGTWTKYEHLLREVICSGNVEHYTYLIRWMARAVQKPGDPGEVAVVLRGIKGGGKGSAIRPFSRLFGSHYFYTNDPGLLNNQFNYILYDKVVLSLDEAVWAGNHEAESRLKGWITEPDLAIRKMQTDHLPARNCLHILLSSNADWVVPASDDERRFFVLDIDPARARDSAYFGAITKEMEEDGGLAALLYDLQRMDLSTFNVRDVPQTEALRDQQMLSLSPLEDWWHVKLVNGELLPDTGAWPTEIKRHLLHANYVSAAQFRHVKRKDSEAALGIALRRLVGKKNVGGRRGQTFTLPSLAECRAIWDRNNRTNDPWPEVEREYPRAVA